MKKYTLLIIFTILIFALSSCTQNVESQANDNKIIVAVSIVPEATFVEKIAGDLVQVVTMIPPGNSPANYEPTMAQMTALSDASIYFTMQVPTEESNILPKVSDFNDEINMVYLRDQVSEVYPIRTFEEEHSEEEHSEEEHSEEEHSEEEHEHEGIDPHIWLSPKRVMVMVQVIADELSILDEANAQTYQTNASAYIKELEALDEDVKEIVSNMDTKSFMIYHGAYGYFADDYGLEMISIEASGKEATASQMEDVIDHAIEENITSIFYQDEFDDTQANTIANEIGGSVVQSSPLSDDYIGSLKEFANALANQ